MVGGRLCVSATEERRERGEREEREGGDIFGEGEHIASSLKPRSEQMDDDFSMWEIVAVAVGTDGVDAYVFEKSFELLKFMGEAPEVLKNNITIAGAKVKNWSLPIKAGHDVIRCVWLEPKDRSAPCKEYNYYPDLAESLLVDATDPGGGVGRGCTKRNPWVFVEVEKLLGSRTMGLEIMSQARKRSLGRDGGIKTYNIDDETLAALTEAGDDFERIHEVGGEV
jgi:hypothetical protein